MALSCSRGDLNWILEKFPHRKGYQALQQAAQASGGISICEVFRRCVDV